MLKLFIGGKNVPALVYIKAEDIIETIGQLINVTGMYSWVDVSKVDIAKGIVLLKRESNNITLNVGHHSIFMKGAEKALISAYTIGTRFEERIKRLNKNGKFLEAYLTDCVSILAILKAGDYIKNLAEEESVKRGLGVSAYISPGYLESWPLSDQKNLCSILDLEKIGLTLNESNVLTPFKSVFCMIGIGPGFTSRKVGLVCKFCNVREKCWLRDKN